MNNFQDYKLKLSRESKVVDLRTGNILELSANSYDPYNSPLTASRLDIDGYYLTETVNEENWRHYPFISDYINLPENKAIFYIIFQEFEKLRNNLRNV